MLFQHQYHRVLLAHCMVETDQEAINPIWTDTFLHNIFKMSHPLTSLQKYLW